MRATGPRVAGAAAYALSIPFRQAFTHSRAERTACDSVLVRVVDSDGCEGWGEGAPRPYVTGETVATVLADLAAAWPAVAAAPLPRLDGPDGLSPLQAGLPAVSASRLRGAARAAVELAVLDCVLRRSGRPMSSLLPPTRRAVCYSGVIGAGRLEVARTNFNAYFPLIRLGRLGEADELLLECQQVFSQENDLLALGMVLSARADLEGKLSHQAEAVELQERALRFRYLTGDVAGIATSHFSLASHLSRADRRRDALPHRLAAALIWFQTESGRLAPNLTVLAEDLTETTAPTSFAGVCVAVERVEGVRFRELFQRLPQRAATGDDALAQVLALAVQLPDAAIDIERLPAEAKLIIDAVVATVQGDQAAAEDLELALTVAAGSENLAALVAAIRRVLDGERDEDTFVAGLRAIDTAILHWILVGVADTGRMSAP